MGKQGSRQGQPNLGDARPKGSGDRQVPIAFPDAESMPIYFVNAVTLQLGNLGEVIMTLAQATLPVIAAANDADREREFAKITRVNAKVVARLAFTPESLQYVATAINAALKELGVSDEESEGEDAEQARG